MASAADYLCTSCCYRAREVTSDFDSGFLADVVTPIVCCNHRIVVAATGLKAWDKGWFSERKGEYPCPQCGSLSPTWDRTT
jgi:hypothetical protein